MKHVELFEKFINSQKLYEAKKFGPFGSRVDLAVVKKLVDAVGKKLKSSDHYDIYPVEVVDYSIIDKPIKFEDKETKIELNINAKEVKVIVAPTERDYFSVAEKRAITDEATVGALEALRKMGNKQVIVPWISGNGLPQNFDYDTSTFSFYFQVVSWDEEFTNGDMLNDQGKLAFVSWMFKTQYDGHNYSKHFSRVRSIIKRLAKGHVGGPEDTFLKTKSQFERHLDELKVEMGWVK